ncbi:MAG: ribosome biogenesis GTPase Der [Candidatus Caldatribacteriaceae bacterium]
MRDNLPLCVIVGRTNVGKSTLFNSLAGERVAIVDSSPGVTRDWIERVVSFWGLKVRLVDTGGLLLDRKGGDIQKKVEEKVWQLLEKARLILFLVDGRVPLTAVELEVVRTLHKKNLPFFLVVNKREGVTHEPLSLDIARIGAEKTFQISAKHGDGISRLKEAIVQELREWKGISPLKTPSRDGIPVVIVGKPNVGKSTLFNSLLGEERAIVSSIPGTTRDVIESPLWGTYGRYLLVDTAGLTRRKSVKDRVTFYATLRTEGKIEEAQLCLLVVDPLQGVTRQDKRIAQEIQDLGKCCIVFVNKVDLVQERNPFLLPEKLCNRARADLPPLYYAAFLAGSALDASGVREKLLPLMSGVITRFHQTVHPDVLNGKIREEINRRFSALPREKKWQVAALLQRGIAPPLFLVVVEEGVREREEEEQCVRIVEKVLREEIDWEGVPLRIKLQRKGKRVPQSILELS